LQILLGNSSRPSDVALTERFGPPKTHEKNKANEDSKCYEESEVKEGPSHVVILSDLTRIDNVVADHLLAYFGCNKEPISMFKRSHIRENSISDLLDLYSLKDYIFGPLVKVE